MAQGTHPINEATPYAPKRTPGTNFITDFDNSKVSYFVGLDAVDGRVGQRDPEPGQVSQIIVGPRLVAEQPFDSID